MFNKYYQDELTYLRQLGAEFAAENPTAAAFLAEPGADPDVERLLQGVAFLTGKLRQKLDDELPELTQTLMQMLWPHYLRPIPAMNVVEFQAHPRPEAEARLIPRGVEIESLPVDDTPCRFRTCYDIRLLPLRIEEVRSDIDPDGSGRLTLRLALLADAEPSVCAGDKLRLYLHGDPVVSYALYLCLSRRLRDVAVQPLGSTAERSPTSLGKDCVEPVGFGEGHDLLPYPSHSFPGYRLFQEFYSLPQKFFFFDVDALSVLPSLGIEQQFELIFELANVPREIEQVALENVRLHCTPVVNLTDLESDPIRVDQEKSEYLVRPGARKPWDFEIFSINRVRGWETSTVEETDYPPFYTFDHALAMAPRDGMYYVSRLKNAVVGRGVDTYLSFVNGEQSNVVPHAERVVADLTCSNGELPSRLQVGDLRRSTSSSPEFATCRDLARASPSLAPPMGGELAWRLIANLSTNYLSLASWAEQGGSADQSLEALRIILGTYNFQAQHDRQAERANKLRLEGILSIRAHPEERIHRGSVVRGSRIRMEMQEDNFAHEGEMLLFASVLDEFLAQYASINSFTHLSVHGITHGEEYFWSPRAGQQHLI